ncbi:MAG TPA: LLM class F420-dependent oxidoreductase [Candidatus Binataceae bacterium]|nr:LLM class F420-dependent oxidoreductase [Candidatus Binataceae bacterium]
MATTFGVMMFPTDYAIQPIELARAVEERGLDSLYFPEHTHIPTSRRSPWPGGGDLPTEYWHTHDPFVALGAAAAVTKRIQLGTGICLVVERDPIVLAKECASLDTISGGRLVLGIGGGWNAEEMADHGTDFRKRWSVLRERVLAMRAIWTTDPAEFHGEHVNFPPMWAFPKPVQQGGPPVLLGSEAKRCFERVVDYCDGWMPIYRRDHTLAEGVGQLREVANRAGRRFESLRLSVFAVPGREDEAKKLMEIGFHDLIFGLPPAPADKVLPLLDTYAALKRKMVG